MPVSKSRRLSLLDEAIQLVDEVLKLVPERHQMPRQVRDSCGYFVEGEIIRRTSMMITLEVTGEKENQIRECREFVTGDDATGRRVDFDIPTRLLVQLGSIAEDLEISIPDSCGFRTVSANGATLFQERVWRLSMQGFRAKLVSEREFVADEEKRKAADAGGGGGASTDDRPATRSKKETTPKRKSKDEIYRHRVFLIVAAWEEHHFRPNGYYDTPMKKTEAATKTTIDRRTFGRTLGQMFGANPNAGWNRYESLCTNMSEMRRQIQHFRTPTIATSAPVPGRPTGPKCSSCGMASDDLSEHEADDLDRDPDAPPVLYCAECWANHDGQL